MWREGEEREIQEKGGRERRREGGKKGGGEDGNDGGRLEGREERKERMRGYFTKENSIHFH